MSAVSQGSASVTEAWHVAAFYQFRPVNDATGLVAHLQALTNRVNTHAVTDAQPVPRLRGTILVAEEGINGTIAGTSQALETVFSELHRLGFEHLIRRDTRAREAPFHRMKVRYKREIVSMGQPGLDLGQTGDYVEPADWDRLLADPTVTVVDTRNDYETRLGSFAGARAPQTASFRDFPAWADANLDPDREPRVAMFCTGGIRCEKATAYLKARGFEQVFHLRGGILNYLEQVPREKSSWEGECFVFDDRVTVDHELKAGSHTQCFNCRMPLSQVQLDDPRYEQHVSCPYCHDRIDAKRRDGLLERARQMALAQDRGQTHLGAAMGSENDAGAKTGDDQRPRSEDSC